MKKVYSAFIFSIAAGVLHVAAQGNSVTIHQDSRLAYLYNTVDSVYLTKQLVDGYSVLVVSTQNREEAYRLKAKLMSLYSSHNVSLSFQTPFFKLTAGIYLTKEEAIHFSNKLNNEMKIETNIVPRKFYSR